MQDPVVTSANAWAGLFPASEASLPQSRGGKISLESLTAQEGFVGAASE